jgi:hypothetical protein
MNGCFYLQHRWVFAVLYLTRVWYNYNAIKNFNTIKIVAGIAIYNIFPDIVSE